MHWLFGLQGSPQDAWVDRLLPRFYDLFGEIADLASRFLLRPIENRFGEGMGPLLFWLCLSSFLLLAALLLRFWFLRKKTGFFWAEESMLLVGILCFSMICAYVPQDMLGVLLLWLSPVTITISPFLRSLSLLWGGSILTWIVFIGVLTFTRSHAGGGMKHSIIFASISVFLFLLPFALTFLFRRRFFGKTKTPQAKGA